MKDFGKNRTITDTKVKRNTYLDVLRVVAVFAVMVIHLAATGYQEAAAGSDEWIICLVFNSITRFAVPVFVMISGAMYLDPDREVTATHLLKKAGRLMAVFFFWSFAYALAESLKTHTLFSAGYFLSVAQKTVTGHYHMWYVYMIAALYLATPFLRPIAADRKLLRLFLAAAFLLNHGIRLFLLVPGLEHVTNSVIGSADMGIFSGFTGYYCLGYYLYSSAISNKQARTVFVISAALLAAAIFAGILLESPGAVFSEKMPHMFLYSAGVFLLVKSAAEGLEKSQRAKRIIGKLAPCTFGMYLVHPVFNFALRKAGLYALTIDPLLCVPLCSVLVWAASFAAVLLLRKLPVLKRFV